MPSYIVCVIYLCVKYITIDKYKFECRQSFSNSIKLKYIERQITKAILNFKTTKQILNFAL